MRQCWSLNLLSVSCTTLLSGTLEEGRVEGSLDLDCIACSYHSTALKISQTRLLHALYSSSHQTYLLILDQPLFS